MSVTRDEQGRTERKAVMGEATCRLCAEKVRDEKGLWVKEVVIWDGLDNPICMNCALIVWRIYENVESGLYLGPGRQVV